MAADSSEDCIHRTPFRASRGVYERYKAEAFARHLRALANMADISQSVAICRRAPDRPWVSLQEWEDLATGVRTGQWTSDIEFVRAP